MKTCGKQIDSEEDNKQNSDILSKDIKDETYVNLILKDDENSISEETFLSNDQEGSKNSGKCDDPQEKLRQQLINELLNQEKPELPVITEAQSEEISSAQIKKEEVYKEVVIPKVSEPEIKKIDINPETLSQEITDSVEKERNKSSIDSIIHVVGFELGKEFYGLNIMGIREIIRMTEITKVPKAPDFIEGVINLRGSVIPVINLRTKVKMSKKEYGKDTRIIVTELKNFVIGFIVDAVKEVLRIPEHILAPPPVLTVNKNVDYITAIAQLENRLLILMDPERIISAEENKKINIG